jgi:predicted 3-demethylubiquinone-9 3-methyltransferase (glyoxalase superfamily)
VNPEEEPFMPSQKIRTFLWYDHQAEEAVRFYTSLFEDSQVTRITRVTEAGPGPPGSVMVVEFTLAGVEYVALNGGPAFPFTEAISLSVDCADQEEVDRLWERLSEGGSTSQCGWLKDRYGLWWQIVPSVLPQYLGDPDPKKTKRVMSALLGMTKLDIEQLRQAYNGG